MLNRSPGYAALTIGLLAAGPAEAHLLDAGGGGLAAGFGHPFSGWDHVLAMTAVGIWTLQIGRSAGWVLLAVFLAAMAGGGLLGWLGLPIPAVETGIAVSVLALGLLIGFAMRPGLLPSVVLVALFAVFHGHAHGAELPEWASALPYGLGFLLATASLHAAGLALGWLATKPSGQLAFRTGGAAISLAGLLLLLG